MGSRRETGERLFFSSLLRQTRLPLGDQSERSQPDQVHSGERSWNPTTASSKTRPRPAYPMCWREVVASWYVSLKEKPALGPDLRRIVAQGLPPKKRKRIHVPRVLRTEDDYFTMGKNWLIESELMLRGSRVRDVLVRHQHDSQLRIYTGPASGVPSRGDVCRRLLERLKTIESGKEPPPDWKLSLYPAGEVLGIQDLAGIKEE